MNASTLNGACYSRNAASQPKSSKLIRQKGNAHGSPPVSNWSALPKEKIWKIVYSRARVPKIVYSRARVPAMGSLSGFLGGSLPELNWLGSGIYFELPRSLLLRIGGNSLNGESNCL